MITKPQIICDGCQQPITTEAPALIEFIPIRGGLFLNLPAAKVEHRIIAAVQLHSHECFGAYCDRITNEKIKADADAAAKAKPAA